MTHYELSISSDYVPSWGVTEAIREFFQNALDEQTRDPESKMFFNYDSESQTFRIGNRHGKLDAKTLLFGYTDKNDQKEMIGNHGEGYKIATVVLLRLNKQITIYNYGCRQVWKPRFVKSRRYGVRVPTFAVDSDYVWEEAPENDLTIEIKGITPDEFHKIAESNLHMRASYRRNITEYGELLRDEDMKSKIFVGGLYICTDPRIEEVGVNFNPDVVRIERDRSMVDGFDVQWYLSHMISESDDYDLITETLSTYSGAYIQHSRVKSTTRDRIAREFLEEHGYDAVPISEESEKTFCMSANVVVVSRSKKELILESDYYKIHCTAGDVDESLVSTQLMHLANEIKAGLSKSQVTKLSDILRSVRELEAKLKDTEADKEVNS